MIIYIILAVVFVVLLVLSFLEYSNIIDTRGIATGAFLFVLIGGFSFIMIDNTATRKNVETIPMSATVDKTYYSVHKHGNSYKKDYYIVYTFEDGKKITDNVGYTRYKEYREGDALNGAKVYYTTGITNINTYSYVIYWKEA